jgi:hypothetical protein
MWKTICPRSFRIALLLGLVAAGSLIATSSFAENHTTKPFAGNTVNGGTVTLSKQGNQTILTLSEDFKVPGSPDPHWQLVDSKGTVYLLNRLKIKEEKINKSIVVPPYIRDIAKVQMWCAWAEVVLGEAPFGAPIMAQR